MCLGLVFAMGLVQKQTVNDFWTIDMILPAKEPPIATGPRSSTTFWIWLCSTRLSFTSCKSQQRHGQKCSASTQWSMSFVEQIYNPLAPYANHHRQPSPPAVHRLVLFPRKKGKRVLWSLAKGSDQDTGALSAKLGCTKDVRPSFLTLALFNAGARRGWALMAHRDAVFFPTQQ